MRTNQGGKVAFNATGAFAAQKFPGDGLKSFALTNDDTAVSLVVLLDDRKFTLGPSETLTDTAGFAGDTVLEKFEVTSGNAWRFVGRF